MCSDTCLPGKHIDETPRYEILFVCVNACKLVCLLSNLFDSEATTVIYVYGLIPSIICFCCFSPIKFIYNLLICWLLQAYKISQRKIWARTEFNKQHVPLRSSKCTLEQTIYNAQQRLLQIIQKRSLISLFFLQTTFLYYNKRKMPRLSFEKPFLMQNVSIPEFNGWLGLKLNCNG